MNEKHGGIHQELLALTAEFMRATRLLVCMIAYVKVKTEEEEVRKDGGGGGDVGGGVGCPAAAKKTQISSINMYCMKVISGD